MSGFPYGYSAPAWQTRLDREHDAQILVGLSRVEAHTTEQICLAAFPDHGPRSRYAWFLVCGRLNSLQRRGLVVRVGPKLWRRTWLA